MTRMTLRHSIGAFFLGATVGVAGCNHADPHPVNGMSMRTASNTPPAGGTQPGYASTGGAPATTAWRQTARSPYMPEMPSQPALAGARQAADMQPVVLSHPMPSYTTQASQMNEAGGPVAAAQSVAAAAAGPEGGLRQVDGAAEGVASLGETLPGDAVQQVSKEAMGNVDSFHNREAIPRRSFVDLTAQPWFKHTPDYSALEGQVSYSHIDKAWRLRFASLDEIDSYGGSVTLVDNPALEGLKEGQHVRVQGRLVDPDRHEAGSAYKVQSLQPADR
jgi:hypothetical protein